MNHDFHAPAPESDDQCADHLAEWMALAEPALPLTPALRDQGNRGQILSVWLSQTGALSISPRFLNAHSQWSPSDAQRAAASMRRTCASLDLIFGAQMLDKNVGIAISRASCLPPLPGEELMHWQLGIQNLHGALTFLIEGSFPRAAFERAVLRSPFPAFMGEVSEQRREDLFCDRFLSELNAVAATGEFSKQPRGFSRFSSEWIFEKGQTNDKASQHAFAQMSLPGAELAAFSAQARLPYEPEASAPSFRPSLAPRQPSLRNLEQAFQTDFARIADFLAQALDLPARPAMRVETVVDAKAATEISAQIERCAISRPRLERLAAAHELVALQGVVRSFASTENGQGQPFEARSRAAPRL